MRVLFANSTKTWGGVKTWTIRLLDVFVKRNVRCFVAARPMDPFLAAAKEKGASPVPFVFGADYSPLAILKACAILRRTSPCLVVTNVSKELRSFGIAAKYLGIPVIARIGLGKDIPDTWRHRFENHHLVKAMLVPAQAVKDELARIFPADKIHVIHNGVSVPEIAPPLPGEQEPCRVVFIGKMHSRKGVPVLLEAMEALSRQGLPVQFTLAGDGPLLSLLKEKYGRCRNIRFLGQQENVMPLLIESHIAVLHSEYEGFPNTLLEYMAAGRAIVTTPVNGIREMLAPGREALFVEYGDVQRLIETLGRLIRDPKRQCELGAAAHLRARKDFNIQTQAERVLHFFSTMTLPHKNQP